MNSWSEREKEILRMLVEQTEAVLACLSTMKEVFRRFLNEEGNAEEKVKEFTSLRERVSEVKEQILVRLSEWHSERVDRESLIHLVNRIDRIAASAGFAINNFIMLERDGARIVLDEDDFSAMIDGALKCVEVLSEAVNEFTEGKKTTSMIDEVDRMEHLVDEEHLKLRRRLQDEKFWSIPMNLAIGISRVIDGVESVADNAEDATEILRRIITKLG